MEQVYLSLDNQALRNIGRAAVAACVQGYAMASVTSEGITEEHPALDTIQRNVHRTLLYGMKLEGMNSEVFWKHVLTGNLYKDFLQQMEDIVKGE